MKSKVLYQIVKTMAFVVVYSLCLDACGGSSTPQQEATNEDSVRLTFPVTIDIESKMHEFSENHISYLIEDIEYVPLEFTKECPVGGNSIPVVTDQYIFMIGYKIFVFSRAGKFIRTIGRSGKGPGEYGAHLMNPEIDVANKLIYIRQFGGNRILKYDFEGAFLGDIRLPISSYSEIGQLWAIDHQAVFMEFAVGFPYWTEYKIGWCISPEGELLYTQPSHVASHLKKVDRREAARHKAPYMGHKGYKFRNNSMIYEPINDTIFVLTTQGLQPRFVLNFGKYRSLEVMTNPQQWYSKSYAWIGTQGLTETERFLFIQFTYDERAYTGIFDKTRNEFSLKASEKIPELWIGSQFDYLVNDFDGGLASFIPRTGAWAVSVEWISEKLTPEHFARMKGKVKHPEKMEALQKLVSKLNENDNPVVMIYHFKK